VCVEGSYFEAHANGADELKEGDMIAHPPNEVHADHWNSPNTAIFALELSPAASRLFASVSSQGLRRRGTCAAKVLNRLGELAATGSGSGWMDLLCTAELLMPLIEAEQSERSQTCRRLMRAAAAIDEHPELAWCIDDLASIAGYQRTYFVEAFRSAFGHPPGQYLRLRRLRCALRMIVAGAGNLTDVAHASGFYDSAHMSRTFRELLGAPPTRLS
jgi:AraC-like DNA-binding protein